MKIKLDRTVCDGFGKCAEHAPSVFSLDEWGYASLAGAAEVPPDLEPRVRRAILDCPVDAITEPPRAHRLQDQGPPAQDGPGPGSGRRCLPPGPEAGREHR
jgi:ferredoxin